MFLYYSWFQFTNVFGYQFLAFRYVDNTTKNDVFLKTCNKDLFSSQNANSGRNCKYLHHDKDFPKIGPLKHETLRQAPFLSVFHELIKHDEIEWLIRETTPKLFALRTDMQYKNEKSKGTVYVKLIMSPVVSTKDQN